MSETEVAILHEREANAKECDECAARWRKVVSASHNPDPVTQIIGFLAEARAETAEALGRIIRARETV